MIRPSWGIFLMNRLVLLWHECGENAAVFCYRISRSAATRIRSRAENIAASF
jgi:hypothetical protein